MVHPRLRLLLSWPVPVRPLILSDIAALHTHPIEKSHLWLLAETFDVPLHITCNFLHILVHHVVRDRHGLISLVWSHRHHIVMIASCSPACDLTGVAVPKAVGIRVHKVRFVNQLVGCLEFRGMLATYLKCKQSVLDSWRLLLLILLLR